MDLGFFAINREREATLLNEEVLKYTRNDTPKVRWYGRGNVENGDMVLYFGRNAAGVYRRKQARAAPDV